MNAITYKPLRLPIHLSTLFHASNHIIMAKKKLGSLMGCLKRAVSFRK